MGNISNVIPAAAGNAYSYDDVGNRDSMTVTDGSGTRVHMYAYDDIYQITEVNYPQELSYLATDTTFNEACPERL